MSLSSSFGGDRNNVRRLAASASGFQANTIITDNNRRRGRAGLSNLGNTCFLNSALQCLAHSPGLAAYFIAERHRDDLNRDNVIGMGGELAEAYGALVKDMWAGKVGSVAPRVFKAKLGALKPEFAGYRQQDSHEVLTFLLDGLHEDLNRIKIKPYIEDKDSDGRPDDEVADECWGNYKMRNDSIIVDLFHGQLKSTLTCPDCRRTSVRFDPLGAGGLQVPLSRTPHLRTVVLSLVWCAPARVEDGRRVTSVRAQVKVSDNAAALAAAVRDAARVPASSGLALFEIFRGRIYRRLLAADPVEDIATSDILVAFAYAPVVPAGVRPGSHRVPTLDDRERLLVAILPGDAGDGDSHALPQQFGLVAAPVAVALPTWPAGTSAADAAVRDRDWAAPRLRQALALALRPGQEDLPKEDLQPWSTAFDVLDLATGVASALPGAYGAAGAVAADSNGSLRHVVQKCLTWRPGADLVYDRQIAAMLPATPSKVGDAPLVGAAAAISLEDCIAADFANLSSEVLDADNTYYCSGCRAHVNAEKVLDLWRLPKNLIIHLKRFQQVGYLREKRDTPVRYPLRGLDMGQFLRRRSSGGPGSAGGPQKPHVPVLYDLYAVSNHFGGLGGGHYTASVRHLEDGEWLNFDDSHVSECVTDLSETAGYVLFYTRQEDGGDGEGGSD